MMAPNLVMVAAYSLDMEAPADVRAMSISLKSSLCFSSFTTSFNPLNSYSYPAERLDPNRTNSSSGKFLSAKTFRNSCADSLGVSSSRWLFLTGSKDSLYKAARVSYLLDDPRNGNDKIENQFIHTQFFALVDRNGRVRKIYDGLKKDELDQLEKDVPALLKESTSSGNNMFSNNPG